MSIRITTVDANALLANIYKAIDDRKIVTWQYDKDGDFTHTAEQWRNKAWLRPKKETGALVLTIMPPKDVALSTEIYAIYHGRFIEAVLAHFDKQFSSAAASALPKDGDRV
jgi:hypothetical protein